MGLAHEGAAGFRLAAQPPHFGAEVLGDLLALVGAVAEDLLEASGFAVRRRVLIAVDAVDQRRNEAVEGRNFVLTIGHMLTPDMSIGSA